MVSSTHEHHEYARRNKFPHPKSTEIKENWKQRGFSFNTVQLKTQDGEFHRKSMDKDLLLVADGDIECRIGNDAPLKLHAGDELYVPEQVQLVAVGDANVTVFVGEM